MANQVETTTSVSNLILNFLQEIGCCWRCSLRFTSVRDCELYRREIKEEGEEPNEKCLKSNPCVVCIGLVQDYYYQQGLNQVIDDIIKADYDAKTFTCTISLPVSLMLREHAVWLQLLSRFPEVYDRKNVVKTEYITSLKDIWKFIHAESIGKRIDKKFELNNSPFQIQINVLFKDDESECSNLVDMSPAQFKKRYKQTRVYRGEIFTRNAAQSVLSEVGANVFIKHYTLKVPDTVFHYGNTSCVHTSIHIAGRYNKYSRNLSQTPWVIDGKKRMETSTQELIVGYLEPFFKVQTSKFSSSGREDVDVRTLGEGRPFAVELIDPHRTSCSQPEMKQLEEKINQSTLIAVRYLQMVSKEQLTVLKDGEEHKTKSYSALCVMLDGGFVTDEEMKLLDQKEVVIMQKTPLRVLHRRPLAVRPRTIHEMQAQALVGNANHFILRIKTQAGTYIKEFVHGDFNRTTPNLCSILGRQVDIVALDVDHVELDWPPPMPY